MNIMQPLKKRTIELQGAILAACQKLQIDARAEELAVFDGELASPDIWRDVERAQSVARKAAELREQVAPWVALRMGVQESIELTDMNDESLITEVTVQIDAQEAEFNRLRKPLLFNGEYDSHSAIVKLSSGAGGTDAQDWCEMLERMYLRWAERTGVQVELLERSAGEEAGIKNATYAVRGSYVYGKLRGEHGVHRLVRLSPFNSDNLRQTSFALVEVIPEIDTPDEVVIDDKDLKIDVYRAGGHGGQSVNTTDSAVRVTHIPSGIVVAIQNERSQLQNKETAMKILRGRLAQLQLEQHAESLADLRANESAGWGAQIRNYVLHPYSLVKDTRTKHETRNVQDVLDGEIDEFIDAYLNHQ
jgi:peptide chain release factor 2